MKYNHLEHLQRVSKSEEYCSSPADVLFLLREVARLEDTADIQRSMVETQAVTITSLRTENIRQHNLIQGLRSDVRLLTSGTDFV